MNEEELNAETIRNIRNKIKEAVQAEREACAKVADEHMDGTPEWNSAANNIASAIRARGQS